MSANPKPKRGGARPGGGRPLIGESKRVKVAMTLPGSELAIFDRMAKYRGISRSEAMAEAMTDYIRHHDPLIQALENAQEDDEPLTAEDIAAIEEAKAQARRGEVISSAEARRRLLG